MRRRLIPSLFWAMVFVSVALPLALQMRALAVPPSVPNLQGKWAGFFQDVDGSGQIGMVLSAIRMQDFKRIGGDATFSDLERAALFNSINFQATLAQDDFLVGTGPTLTGRAVFHAGVQSFGGGPGDAAVLVPDFLFTPVRGRAARVPSIVLRPFFATNPPDIMGMGMGTFASRVNPDFRGTLTLQLFEPPGPGAAFPGVFDLMPPGSDQKFQIMATSSDDKRLIMIGQGPLGRFTVQGAVRLPVAGGPTSVDALYRLMLNDGRLDFGAYNFNIASSIIE